MNDTELTKLGRKLAYWSNQWQGWSKIYDDALGEGEEPPSRKHWDDWVIAKRMCDFCQSEISKYVYQILSQTPGLNSHEDIADEVSSEVKEIVRVSFAQSDPSSRVRYKNGSKIELNQS